jgi:hypothetical protein
MFCLLQVAERKVTRADLELRLAEAEVAVAKPIVRAARVRLLLGELERGGFEVAAAHARDALTAFEEISRLHIEERDRIKRELDAVTTARE